MNFTYYAPLRIDFSKGAISRIASYTSRNGNRVMLITGKNHLRKTGVLNKVLDSFKKSSKIEDVVVFDKARENPDTKLIDEASQTIIKNRLNVIVAIGGGSSMDLAKTSAIAAKQNKPIWEIVQSPELGVMQSYPVICAPTTSGSGSEVTKYAVLNDDKQKIKVAIGSEHIYPLVSIIDPELTFTMSKNIIANTGFDALSHAIEAYTSKSSSPITDLYCQKAISLAGENLKKAYDKDERAMENMSLAAAFGGLALNVGRASLPHAMEHSLSAYIPSIAHGLGLSIVMIPFMKRAIKCTPERFADIAYLSGEDISNMPMDKAAEKAIDAVEKIKEQIGLNKKLSDLGFDRDTIKEMVDKTFWTMAHGVENSPCNFNKEDILNMYLEVL